MSVGPRHADCLECRFFNPNRANARCVPCGAGEFFEEKPDRQELNPDKELRWTFTGHYDDEN